ncbi:L,D-transpeptidase family protein [Sulfurihydrogenibium sp.]|uniref:L,D-transpeptidase family protein n=1 Tax=Sulfurihydrogenibium sp. TaxID=2053621 RepID=UPI00262D477D|nr:L,D-transpeptidase family protein [Sulfurihydrogenibium sp.]
MKRLLLIKTLLLLICSAGKVYSAGSVDLRIYLKNDKSLKSLYQSTDFLPIWINDSFEEKTEKLKNLIENLDKEGLNPTNYNLFLSRNPVKDEIELSKLTLKICLDLYNGTIDPKNIFETWNLPKKKFNKYKELAAIIKENQLENLPELCQPNYEGYLALKQYLSKYYEIMASYPSLPKINKKLKPKIKDKEVKKLRQLLYIYGFYDGNTNSDIYDDKLLESVKRFQESRNLEADGVIGVKTLNELNRPLDELIDIIKINMEKYRWLPENLAENRIEVNIPSFELKYYENNTEVLSTEVIVGKNYEEDFRPTPIYYGKIEKITINPYWYVPKKIAAKDILKKIKSNPRFLEDFGFKVFYNGQEVDYKKIKWRKYNENNFNFTLIQSPGDKNFLGRIKITFSNPFQVYLHDTPFKELFKHKKRAFSSGCIRINDPLSLTSYILNKDKSEILDYIDSNKTIDLVPSKDIYIYIFYFTALLKNDTIYFYEDLYNFDKKILNLMLDIDE